MPAHTIESLAARVAALEDFVRDMAEVSASIKALAAHQARDLETVFAGYADQILERCRVALPAVTEER